MFYSFLSLEYFCSIIIRNQVNFSFNFSSSFLAIHRLSLNISHLFPHFPLSSYLSLFTSLAILILFLSPLPYPFFSSLLTSSPSNTHFTLPSLPKPDNFTSLSCPSLTFCKHLFFSLSLSFSPLLLLSHFSLGVSLHQAQKSLREHCTER